MRTDYRCDMCGKHPALYTFTVKVPIDRPRYVETRMWPVFAVGGPLLGLIYAHWLRRENERATQ